MSYCCVKVVPLLRDRGKHLSPGHHLVPMLGYKAACVVSTQKDGVAYTRTKVSCVDEKSADCNFHHVVEVSHV